jgi:hypothetical protein
MTPLQRNFALHALGGALVGASEPPRAVAHGLDEDIEGVACAIVEAAKHGWPVSLDLVCAELARSGWLGRIGGPSALSELMCEWDRVTTRARVLSEMEIAARLALEALAREQAAEENAVRAADAWRDARARANALIERIELVARWPNEFV